MAFNFCDGCLDMCFGSFEAVTLILDEKGLKY